MSSFQPLEGYRVVSLALNLPGPVAIHRMRKLGASVVKVEPLSGDPMEFASPTIYAWLHEGIVVEKQDLKSPAGLQALHDHLKMADLFLTSSRLAALERLGLGWHELADRYPSLVMVAIVGNAPPDENHPGHDLTYQAQHGLLSPPNLPRSLFADLGGRWRGSYRGLDCCCSDTEARECRISASNRFAGRVGGVLCPADPMGLNFNGRFFGRSASAI